MNPFYVWPVFTAAQVIIRALQSPATFPSPETLLASSATSTPSYAGSYSNNTDSTLSGASSVFSNGHARSEHTSAFSSSPPSSRSGGPILQKSTARLLDSLQILKALLISMKAQGNLSGACLAHLDTEQTGAHKVTEGNVVGRINFEIPT